MDTMTLGLFLQNVVGATIDAPDQDPDWDTGGYATHRAELASLWGAIRAQVKVDHARAARIDEHLAAALTCFDRGERDPGKGLMFRIHNLLEERRLR